MTYDGRPTSSARRSGQRAGRLGRLCGLAVAAIMTASLAFSWSCGPASAQVVEGAPVRHITVTLNKSKTLRFSEPFSSAVIGAPDIADILPMTEETLYVLGKKTGTTSISVFAADKHLIAVVDLEVSLDTASLHGKIATSTGSGDIKVSSANGQVVLSGEASDAVAAARAVDVATGRSIGKEQAGKQAAGHQCDEGRADPTAHAEGALSRGRPFRGAGSRGELLRRQQERDRRVGFGRRVELGDKQPRDKRLSTGVGLTAL